MSVYDIKVKAIDGSETTLAPYKGKAMLVVNVASECGFTPQYQGLQALYEKYAPQGLTVLGFPCNQFGGQEPGSDSQIKEFCDLRFRVTFPMFSKVDVNGPQAHPLFVHLKKEEPGFLGTEAIKWNFTKFLVSPEGQVIKRYGPQTKPEAIAPEIESLLKK